MQASQLQKWYLKRIYDRFDRPPDIIHAYRTQPAKLTDTPLSQIFEAIRQHQKIVASNEGIINFMISQGSRYFNLFADYVFLQFSKANLEHLQELTLWKCQIGQEEGKDLGASRLTSLTKFDIQYSEVVDKGWMGLSRGEWWSRLQILKICNTKISKKGLQAVINGKLTCLKILSLQSDQLGDTACELLQRCPWNQLEELDLSSNQIGFHGCEHLSKIAFPNLRILKLSNNNFKAKGCKHLSKSKWFKLQSLRICNNHFGDDGCKHLAGGPWKDIQTLSLSGDDIGDQGCFYLSRAPWSCIQQLNLRNNKIGVKGFQYFGEAVWRKSMSDLDFCEQIGVPQEQSICISLFVNSWVNLQSVNLIYSFLGEKGSRLLVKAQCKLKTLYINNCGINDKSCRILSKGRWHLEQLYMSYNQIGNEGCRHLANARWQAIREVDLQGNFLTAKGCQYLCKAQWSNIEVIELDDNKVGWFALQLMPSFRNYL